MSSIMHNWYDTETSGPNPTYDQVLQLAAVLTDDDFNDVDVIDERSRMCNYIVPTPGAFKVTGINPYDVQRAKYSYFEFAKKIHSTFSSWKSQSEHLVNAGYNILNFDEEIIRHMFWENLLDPYLSSGKGTSRNDLFPLLRCLYARNPDVFNVPKTDDGKNSFRLEKVAPANGFNGHHAHDAFGDVRATIFVGRMIRDIDRDLWEHMILMGNANNAADFVEHQKVFRLLGVPVLDPGILDVCLITSEAQNKKNKVAWNLAIDPEPYFKMNAVEILDAMKQSGTPFRSVKCNKQPAAFTMDWEFLNRAMGENFEPVDRPTIDYRSNLIQQNLEFQETVKNALELKVLSYDQSNDLEQKIYTGFPSWNDKSRMKSYHYAKDWQERYKIGTEFEKPELRALSIRLLYAHAPTVLRPDTLKQCHDTLAASRFSNKTDCEFTTVGKFMNELHQMLLESPDDPDLINIKKWVLESFPAASHWQPELENTTLPEQDTPQTQLSQKEDKRPSCQNMNIPTPVTRVTENFLDDIT